MGQCDVTAGTAKQLAQQVAPSLSSVHAGSGRHPHPAGCQGGCDCLAAARLRPSAPVVPAAGTEAEEDQEQAGVQAKDTSQSGPAARFRLRVSWLYCTPSGLRTQTFPHDKAPEVRGSAALSAWGCEGTAPWVMHHLHACSPSESAGTGRAQKCSSGMPRWSQPGQQCLLQEPAGAASCILPPAAGVRGIGQGREDA